MVNLLGNAIKFTHEGEIEIRCSVDKSTSKNLEKDKVSLLFEVIDTGIGISEEQRKVLFAPFSQVDGSTTYVLIHHMFVFAVKVSFKKLDNL